MAGFSAQVGAWVRKVKGAEEAIWKQSAQAVVNDAQTTVNSGGRLRIKTGYLRASIMASTAAMPLIDPSKRPAKGAADNSYTYNDGDITAVILNARLGESIYIGYTAAYAAHREYGARGQEPDAFVRTAAMKWPQIVARIEADLKARLGI